MNKIFSSLLVALLSIVLMSPLTASAHERQVFEIGGKQYLFVVGSLGEPVVVDDKTGVDLRVKLADPKNPGDSNSANAKAIEGLDQTLKVEISAGDKKKVFDLKPAYKDPGAYKAVFFPTVQTALTYRFFGTIDGTPVNLSFACNPATESQTAEDKNAVKIDDNVTRTLKVGAFGCPLAKESLGFPEDEMSILGLHEDLHGDLKAVESKITPSNASGATILSIAALAIGVLAFIRTRKG